MEKSKLLVVTMTFCFFLLFNGKTSISGEKQLLVIKGGDILTITKGVIENGIILIEDSKIKKIGKNIIIPKEAKILNAQNSIILPGFVAANTREGLGRDINGDSQILVSPFFRAVDSLTPYEEIYGVKEIVSTGVTTVYTAPKIWTWKAVAGEGCVFKLIDKFIPQMILLPSAGVQMDLSYPEIKRFRSERLRPPRTQMGIVASLRRVLQDAKNYMNLWENYEKGISETKPEKNFELEQLVRVLRGELPARIECEKDNEIKAALEIADEFKIKVILERCMEGYKFVDEIAKRKISCIIGPLREGWGNTMEEKFNTLRNPGILSKAGVKVAIQTENFGNLLTFERTLTIEAAYAVKYGMDQEEALKAITINAAEILGVEKRIGSIEEGKDADIIIMDGHPFDIMSKVKTVIINGEVVFRI